MEYYSASDQLSIELAIAVGAFLLWLFTTNRFIKPPKPEKEDEKPDNYGLYDDDPDINPK